MGAGGDGGEVGGRLETSEACGPVDDAGEAMTRTQPGEDTRIPPRPSFWGRCGVSTNDDDDDSVPACLSPAVSCCCLALCCFDNLLLVPFALY